MVMAEVSENLGAQAGQNIRPTYGYYRQPNGWITISPNTAIERMKYQQEGWEYLSAYGSFDMTPYTADHPLEGLFMFGGAKELPVDQVLQMGLYIEPTALVPTCRQPLTQYHRKHSPGCWARAKRVEFPQLEGVDSRRIGPFMCEFCDKKLPTLEARIQHQSVAHKPSLNNVQLGQSLGDALATALRNAAPAPKDDGAQLARIAQLEAMVAAAVEGKQVVCACGISYDPGLKAEKAHRNSAHHQAWAASHSSTPA